MKTLRKTKLALLLTVVFCATVFCATFATMGMAFAQQTAQQAESTDASEWEAANGAGAMPLATGGFNSSVLFGGGSGTHEDPFLICNEVHLNNMRFQTFEGRDEYESMTLIMGNYKLTNDITVSIEFQPLENFNGRFEGDFYTITFKNLGTDNESRSGLFSTIVGGLVRNLKVKVLGESGIATSRGAICAVFSSGEIYHCYAEGQFSNLYSNADTTYFGGICGKQFDGVVTSCTSSLNITTYGNAGGLVGYLYGGNIIGSTFSGQINFRYYSEGALNNNSQNTKNLCVGGICGRAYAGTIIGCYITGNHPVSYFGPSSNNKYLQPRVGFLIGENERATQRDNYVSSTAINEKGTLKYDTFLGITVRNQLAYFKESINSTNFLIGKQI